MNMERKAKADAVAADLALEEEKKPQSKKKNDKINKVFQLVIFCEQVNDAFLSYCDNISSILTSFPYF